jgi:hypothetical protein
MIEYHLGGQTSTVSGNFYNGFARESARRFKHAHHYLIQDPISILDQAIVDGMGRRFRGASGVFAHGGKALIDQLERLVAGKAKDGQAGISRGRSDGDNGVFLTGFGGLHGGKSIGSDG